MKIDLIQLRNLLVALAAASLAYFFVLWDDYQRNIEAIATAYAILSGLVLQVMVLSIAAIDGLKYDASKIKSVVERLRSRQKEWSWLFQILLFATLFPILVSIFGKFDFLFVSETKDRIIVAVSVFSGALGALRSISAVGGLFALGELRHKSYLGTVEDAERIEAEKLAAAIPPPSISDEPEYGRPGNLTPPSA